MRRLASKIWPKSIAPGLRSRVVKLRGRAFVRMQFELWKVYSRHKYGEQRPISAHGTELIARSNDWRAFWVHKQNGSQRELLEAWRQVVDLKPELCIDVGANYGEFSAPILDEVEELLAVEANPVIFDCLEKTLEGTNARVCNNAVADECGTLTIYSKDELSGFSSLSRDVLARKSSPVGTDDAVTEYEVEAITLDELVKREYDEFPASVVLKIDVEGFEEPVLRGAEELLEQADWWRAIVEFSESSQRKRGVDPQAAWDWMRRFDGFILDESQPLGYAELNRLNSSLPEEMPDHTNLLIGHGNIG